MKLPLLNNPASKSNKSIFTRKIIYYNRSNKLKNENKKNEEDKKILENENTSYYLVLILIFSFYYNHVAPLILIYFELFCFYFLLINYPKMI